MIRMLGALLLLLLAVPAAAAESNVVATRHDAVSLISASDSFVPGKTLHLALRLRLAPGWHTYWSNPGDAGEPATVTLTTGPAAPSPRAIDWPAPTRLPDGPLMSYGYTGDVVLPLTIPTGPAQAGMLHIAATAQWLACAEICVPESGSFVLDLPRGDAAESALAPLFANAAARAPRPSPFEAVLSAGDVLILSGAGLGPRLVADAWFLPATPGLINQGAAQPVHISRGRVAITLRPERQLASEPRLAGVVVLRDPAGQESFLSIAAPHLHGPDWSALPRLLLFALLGGIVLNLMPCVFPVLAIKALALVRLSGAARRQMQLSAGFYTAGVLIAFAALGALMLSLRAAGALVGWGFQFQSVVFVAAVCWLLFAVGLNLAGLFEISGRAAGLGQGLAARPSHAGDFATGLLAVLVATPCTAPFMGLAVAGALAAPSAFAMAVFLAMGLGLALPYVAVALLPGLAARLPRPGSWMVVLRQALAFPVFATCAWLAWVAAIEGGDRAVLVLAAGLVLLSLAAWLLGLSQRLAMRWPGVCAVAAGLAAAAALALLPGLDAASRTGAQAKAEPFSETRLADLRAAGRPVFVDMTAAWCVTCLVNERIALAPAVVRQAFAAHHVTTLRGDWTRRDPAITGYLRAHGSDGVPLYVYYPAGGAGRQLPQILTASRVLDAIEGRS